MCPGGVPPPVPLQAQRAAWEREQGARDTKRAAWEGYTLLCPMVAGLGLLNRDIQDFSVCVMSDADATRYGHGHRSPTPPQYRYDYRERYNEPRYGYYDRPPRYRTPPGIVGLTKGKLGHALTVI